MGATCGAWVVAVMQAHQLGNLESQAQCPASPRPSTCPVNSVSPRTATAGGQRSVYAHGAHVV